jgi:hypothetical protein
LAHKVELDAEFFWADADQNLERFPLYDPLDDDSTEHFRRRFENNLYGGLANLPLEYYATNYAFRAGMQDWITAPSAEIADDLAVARVGLHQRWQTKRGRPGQERIVDWVVLDIDGSFFPKKDRDNFGQSAGMVTYDLRWHLGDRCTLLSDGFFDFFDGGLQTISVGGVLSRPMRGNLYLGLRAIDGPVQSSIVTASVNYRMTEKWIVNAATSAALDSTGNVAGNLSLVRVGESFLLRLGVAGNQSRDNVGIVFSIEPRFLPGKLGRVGGVPIPPAGVFGLE